MEEVKIIYWLCSAMHGNSNILKKNNIPTSGAEEITFLIPSLISDLEAVHLDKLPYLSQCP